MRMICYVASSAYVSIRQHTSAYVQKRQHTAWFATWPCARSAYVSIRQHTSAYVQKRQHTAWLATSPSSSSARPLRTNIHSCVQSSSYADVCWRMLTYADVSCRCLYACMHAYLAFRVGKRWVFSTLWKIFCRARMRGQYPKGRTNSLWKSGEFHSMERPKNSLVGLLGGLVLNAKHVSG